MHIVMECAHRPTEELEVFKELRPDIGFGLGVVDVKATEIEVSSYGHSGSMTVRPVSRSRRSQRVIPAERRNGTSWLATRIAPR